MNCTVKWSWILQMCMMITEKDEMTEHLDFKKFNSYLKVSISRQKKVFFTFNFSFSFQSTCNLFHDTAFSSASMNMIEKLQTEQMFCLASKQTIARCTEVWNSGPGVDMRCPRVSPNRAYVSLVSFHQSAACALFLSGFIHHGYLCFSFHLVQPKPDNCFSLSSPIAPLPNLLSVKINPYGHEVYQTSC